MKDLSQPQLWLNYFSSRDSTKLNSYFNLGTTLFALLLNFLLNLEKNMNNLGVNAMFQLTVNLSIFFFFICAHQIKFIAKKVKNRNLELIMVLIIFNLEKSFEIQKECEDIKRFVVLIILYEVFVSEFIYHSKKHIIMLFILILYLIIRISVVDFSFLIINFFTFFILGVRSFFRFLIKTSESLQEKEIILNETSEKVDLSQKIINHINFGIYAFKNRESLYINSSFKKLFGNNIDFACIIESMKDYYTISDIFKKIRKLICFDMKNPQEYNDFYGEIEKISEQNHHFSSANNTEKTINLPDALKNKKVISQNRSFSDIASEQTLKQYIENLIEENSIEAYLNFSSQLPPKSLQNLNKSCMKKKESIQNFIKDRSQLKNKHLSFSSMTKKISHVEKIENNNFFNLEKGNVKLIKSIFFSKISDKSKRKIFHCSFYKIEESGIFYLVVHEVEWAQLNNLIKEFKETQSKILASLSHELRTPLNSIIILSKELKAHHFSPADEHILSPLLANIKLLSLIVNDLIDFSEITYGKMKIIESNFDLEEVLTETLENYKQLTDYKNITTYLKMDSKIGKIVCSDRTRILQILSNLMSNAVKYTEKGNIIIEAKQFPIFQSNPILEITIEDTGCGFDELTLKSLGTISAKKKAKLAGLGLTISDYLAKYLAPKDFGGIFTRSEVGKGSLFGFLIENKISENSASCTSSKSVGQGEIIKSASKSYISISRTSIVFDWDEISLMPSDSVPQYLKPNAFKNKFKIEDMNLKSPTKFRNSCDLKNELNTDEPSITDKATISKNSNLNFSSTKFSSPKELFNAATVYVPDTIEEKSESHLELRRHKTEIKLSSSKFSEKKEKSSSKHSHLDFMITILSEKVANKGCKCYDILIVDDSSFNLQAFQFFLKKFDLFIDTALSGDQAIEKVQNYYNFGQRTCNCKHYKCIFMDVDMPFKDGIQTSKEIILFGKSVGIDYIIIPWTAFSDKETLNNCQKAGMENFVSKPHDPQMIKLILTKKVLPQFR